MRATITQREKDGGVFGQRREYYVDCDIELTDAERALIGANPDTLLAHLISPGSDTTFSEYRYSPRTYAQGAPLLVAIAFFLAIPALLHPTLAENRSSLFLLLSAIGYWIYTIYDDHEGFPASAEISVGSVLDQPRFSLYARDAEIANTVAADIRKRLDDLDAKLKEAPATVDRRGTINSP